MTRYVVDSSVALKWFFTEPGTDKALCLLRGGAELWAPDLLLLEFDNVICKRQRRQLLDMADANRMQASIRRFPVRLHQTYALLDPAFTLATTTGASMYDAVFAVLAIHLKGRLVTADRRLFECLSGSYDRITCWIDDVPDPAAQQPRVV